MLRGMPPSHAMQQRAFLGTPRCHNIIWIHNVHGCRLDSIDLPSHHATQHGHAVLARYTSSTTRLIASSYPIVVSSIYIWMKMMKFINTTRLDLIMSLIVLSACGPHCSTQCPPMSAGFVHSTIGASCVHMIDNCN